MATYTIRGTSHNIVYTYKTIDGKRKQQWESYSSELEAIQRKAYIDYLQAQNRASDITHEAAEYRRKKPLRKQLKKSPQKMQQSLSSLRPSKLKTI